MLWFKEKIPTDLQILKEIYKNHEHEFCTYLEDGTKTNGNIYIPIDIIKVAKKFKTTNNVIFGRLYYGMNHKYGYEKIENGSKVQIPVFAPVCGDIKNAINLPMLISVLAGLQEQLTLFAKTLIVSIVGVLIALASFGYNFSQNESNTQKDKEIVSTLQTITTDIQLKQKLESEKQVLYMQQLEQHTKYLCYSCHTSKN